MSLASTCLTLALSAGCLLAEDPFQALIRPTDALSAQEELGKLHVPPGFSVALFASEPMINKPINIAFDARGRLWVTSNTEYPFPAPTERWTDAQGTRVKDSRDAIKILEDTDHDGHADKVTDFVDGLNIPIGVLPYGDGCIAWSIPNIWYFADTDGDGKCDQRTILFGPLGYDKDTHGNIASLRLGPDGWVYATHGFSNKSHFAVRPELLKGRKLGDPGTTLDLQSGNVFRFRPDGSAIEIWAHGQVNPFGLCWDAWGNLYSADCHSNPLTQLIHQAYYPSFGKPDDGLGFGPVLCPHSHGSTGLCGVLYVEGGRWGADWDDHLLLGNCVTSKINQDHIVYTGATPHAVEQPDFLTSEDPWFRPVDLEWGPDGALYVADFYNKIIGHYEVDRHHPGRDRERGRIWKISRTSATPVQPPTDAQRLSQQWRWGPPQVEKALAILQDAAAAPQLRRIVAETLIGQPQAHSSTALLKLVQGTPADDASLRHTLRIALRNALALPGALAEVTADDVGEKEIASLLSSLTTPDASAWMLNYFTKHPPDRAALRTALAPLARHLPTASQGTLVELVKAQFPQDAPVQLDLLQALLQGLAQHGTQPAEAVRAWAQQLTEPLAASLTAAPVSDWSGDTAVFGEDSREKAGGGNVTLLSSLPAPRGPEIEVRTGKLRSRTFACPAQLKFWLAGHAGPPADQPNGHSYVRLHHASSNAQLQQAVPPRDDRAHLITWDCANFVGQPVCLEMVDGDKGQAYAWLGLGGLEPAVVAISVDSQSDRWAQLAEITGTLKLASYGPALAAAFTRADLNDRARNAIAQVLPLFPNHAGLLAELFKTAPTRYQRLLGEMLASTLAGAEQLCTLAPPRLLAQPNLAQKLAALKNQALDARIQALTKDLPPANQELEALLKSRLQSFLAAQAGGKADAAAGKVLFTQQCALCHQMEGQGKQIGPQLDGTKNRGAERLCEDILDPNRAVDPNFHLHVLKLTDDSVLAGLQRREEGATLVLADVAGQEHAVEKSRIKENTESALSLMPPTFGTTLSEADFHHLLQYLLEH